MAEDMVFLPKSDLLTLEELDRLCRPVIRHGVTKLRLSGDETRVSAPPLSLGGRQAIEGLVILDGLVIARYKDGTVEYLVVRRRVA